MRYVRMIECNERKKGVERKRGQETDETAKKKQKYWHKLS